MTSRIFPDGAALVIGGSGGVGQAVCREFARAGTNVAITYNKKREVAEKLAVEVRALGAKASVHQLTIGDAARVEAVVEEAAAEHQRACTASWLAPALSQSRYCCRR